MSAAFVMCILISQILYAQTAELLDFGPDGLYGLSEDELQKLDSGDIIFIDSLSKSEAQKAVLIQSVVLFSNTLERTWQLIAATENQPEYLSSLNSVEVLSKSPRQAVEIFTAKILLIKILFGVVQNYDAENKWLHWYLYAEYPENDLDSLAGYWQLYPYDKNRTLARYGTHVALKNVPDFIENMFRKGGAKRAMISVKRYVDSDGQYRK